MTQAEHVRLAHLFSLYVRTRSEAIRSAVGEQIDALLKGAGWSP